MPLAAFPAVSFRSAQGDISALPELDASYIQEKLIQHMPSCLTDRTGEMTSLPFGNEAGLFIDNFNGHITAVYLHDSNIHNFSYSILDIEGDEYVSYTNCSQKSISPVLAILHDYQEGPDIANQSKVNQNEAAVEDFAESALARISDNGFRSGILSANENLSSHEPTRLLSRMDENDISRLYMDFNVSLKHPVLSKGLNPLFEALELNSESHFAQLYFAFTGRFSQYIASRESSPVVSRRFNPELFLRIWNNRGGYWDIGYGHESNGQQTNTELAFQQEAANYEADGQSGQFARDGISRGWDYVSFDWQKKWDRNILPIFDGETVTQFEFRKFLSHGLLQGDPEEYNSWEGAGFKDQPRNDYDGVNLSLQYLFSENEVQCALNKLICLDKLEITQTTGYSGLFKNNTTSLELTTDILGLPLHLWAKSGYNSDLVDYYQYTNSWGLGLEFKSR